MGILMKDKREQEDRSCKQDHFELVDEHCWVDGDLQGSDSAREFRAAIEGKIHAVALISRPLRTVGGQISPLRD
jgi:hypothetical protein